MLRSLAVLTTFERDEDVFGALRAGARGRSNAEIAPLTAKTHVARLFSKLGARNRAQLVVAASESGLVVPGADAGSGAHQVS
jgi:ATP/maltotriose-dependent transcriptional regulator MalT